MVITEATVPNSICGSCIKSCLWRNQPRSQNSFSGRQDGRAGATKNPIVKKSGDRAGACGIVWSDQGIHNAIPYIKEIKIHVYSKRQTWICTTWPSQCTFTTFTFLTKQPRCNAVVLHFFSLHHFRHTFFKKWIDLFPSGVNTRPFFRKLSTPLEPKRITSVASQTVQIDKSYQGNDFPAFFLLNRKPSLSSTVKHLARRRRTSIQTLQSAITSAGLSTVCSIVDMTRYCMAVTRSDNSSVSLAKVSVAFSRARSKLFLHC